MLLISFSTILQYFIGVCVLIALWCVAIVWIAKRAEEREMKDNPPKRIPRPWDSEMYIAYTSRESEEYFGEDYKQVRKSQQN